MGRARRFTIFAVLLVVLIALDRATKACAESSLSLGDPGIDLGPLALTLVHNRGAAFGMGEGAGLVFAGFAFAVVAAICCWLWFFKEHSALEVVAVSLIAAGGIGNMIDRLTTGYVVDFFRFTFVDFPVFNVADTCVTCGVVLFLIWLVFGSTLFGADDEEGGQS